MSSEYSDVVSKIISLVKQFPALYDTTHEDYNRYYKKIQIWNSIASEVNYSDGKVAQTKWRNIRDSYVKHLKSLKTMEPAYKKYRNWQWVEQMAFLKNYLGGNKQSVTKRRRPKKIEKIIDLHLKSYTHDREDLERKSMSKDNDSQETSALDTVESVYGEPSISINETGETYENALSLVQKTKNCTDLAGRTNSPLWFNSTAVVNSNSANALHKFKNDSMASPSPLWFAENNEIVERIESTPPAECDYSSYQQMQSKDYVFEHNGIDPHVDATDLMFLSFAKTLKSLSRKRQIQARMKISEIIGQAELDEENESQIESNHVDSSGGNELVIMKKRKIEQR